MLQSFYDVVLFKITFLFFFCGFFLALVGLWFFSFMENFFIGCIWSRGGGFLLFNETQDAERCCNCRGSTLWYPPQRHLQIICLFLFIYPYVLKFQFLYRWHQSGWKAGTRLDCNQKSRSDWTTNFHVCLVCMKLYGELISYDISRSWVAIWITFD